MKARKMVKQEEVCKKRRGEKQNDRESNQGKAI